MMEQITYMALGAAVMWLLSVLWAWNRHAREAETPAADSGRAYRGVLTLTHKHHHTHELTPETVALLSEAVAEGFRDWFTALDERPVKPARPLSMPDEPEARLAREQAKAATVLRGAERLQADARARGMDLPMADAMKQAMRMYENATDTTN
jgi:hypothetical protein